MPLDQAIREPMPRDDYCPGGEPRSSPARARLSARTDSGEGGWKVRGRATGRRPETPDLYASRDVGRRYQLLRRGSSDETGGIPGLIPLAFHPEKHVARATAGLDRPERPAGHRGSSLLLDNVQHIRHTDPDRDQAEQWRYSSAPPLVGTVATERSPCGRDTTDSPRRHRRRADLANPEKPSSGTPPGGSSGGTPDRAVPARREGAGLIALLAADLLRRRAPLTTNGSARRRHRGDRSADGGSGNSGPSRIDVGAVWRHSDPPCPPQEWPPGPGRASPMYPIGCSTPRGRQRRAAGCRSCGALRPTDLRPSRPRLRQS